MTISNHQFVTRFFPEFNDWLQQKDFLFDRFNRLAKHFESYFLETEDLARPQHYMTPCLEDNGLASSIAGQLHETLVNCDNVDFEQVGVPEGYAIWHFLDRYVRFQKIYLYALELGVLPARYSMINSLDVGAGPCSSIFALSDIYLAMRLFGQERSIPELRNIAFRPDYIEISQGFRNFVHFFTEHANYQEAGNPGQVDPGHFIWNVPFHHGSYDDAVSTNFRMTPEFRRGRDGFHVVMVSHFLTKEGQAATLIPFFKSLTHALRNGGLIVAVGNNKPFTNNINDIHHDLEQLKIKKIALEDHKIGFNHEYRVVERLRQFYTKIKMTLEEKNLAVHPDGVKELDNRIGIQRIKASWKLHLFRKGKLPTTLHSG